MPIFTTSQAAALGIGVKNVVTKTQANGLSRNLVLVATYNPALTSVVPNIPILVASGDDAGNKFGFGYMAHRMARAAFKAHGGSVPTWILPQAEITGAAATSVNTLAFTGPATSSGTLALYIAGERYAVSVANGDAATAIATNVAAAINADPNCPVTATPSSGNVTLTAKSKGLWGNYISVAVNLQYADILPAGVAVTITALTGGTGVPTLSTALAGLGSGSAKNILPNGQQATAMVCGYGANLTIDQTSETTLAQYNGLASSDPPDGCYDHLVAKPFRWFWGDVTTGSTVPSSLVTFASTNVNDRGGGVICAPGSNTHPTEIACRTVGYMEAINSMDPALGYKDIVLADVDPGQAANLAGTRWTNDYTQRDTAVKAGITPTLVVNGAVTLQNVLTFYNGSTAIAQTSNGYGNQRCISIIQNLLNSHNVAFRSPKWQRFKIVADTARVVDPVAKATARDINDVVAEEIALLKSWEQKGWIYQAKFSIDYLKNNLSTAVTVRAGGDGFLTEYPVILSGEGRVNDTTLDFDTSPTIITAGV